MNNSSELSLSQFTMCARVCVCLFCFCFRYAVGIMFLVSTQSVFEPRESEGGGDKCRVKISNDDDVDEKKNSA